MIRVIPNIINRVEREWLIAQAQRGSVMPTYDGKMHGENPMVAHLPMNEMTARIANLLVGNPALVKNTHVLKYVSGSSMDLHADNGVWSEDGEWTVRHFFSSSAIIFLNECDGGETVFPKQGVTIKPTAGTCVLAPSSAEYVHEVKAAGSDRYTFIIRFGEHL